MSNTRYLKARHGIEILHDTGTIQILTGDIDPIVTGLEAEIGSTYLCTTGKKYQKTGSSNIDWAILNPLTNKGDLQTYNSRIPVGNDGQIIKADSTDPNGIKWSDNDNSYIVSNEESTTTGTSYTNKVTLTFTPPSIGDYLIMWNCEVYTEDNGIIAHVRIQEDNTVTHVEVGELVQIYSNGGVNSITGFFVVSDLSDTSHDFALDFASSKSGKTLYIRRSRIVARRLN